jgi:hypothetical protein
MKSTGNIPNTIMKEQSTAGRALSGIIFYFNKKMVICYKESTVTKYFILTRTHSLLFLILLILKKF